MKEICLADPEKKLFLNTSKGKREILEIFIHIKSLTYEQRPDYALIRTRLEELVTKEYYKLNYINPTVPETEKLTDNSPSKEHGCKSSKGVVNSSFTNSQNIIFPFQTAFDGFSNLPDNNNSNKNIINTMNRKLFNGMKQNDLNISNFCFGLQNDYRLSLFNGTSNQMTKRKRKRDEGANLQFYNEDGVNELFKKEEDNNIPLISNLTPTLPFNNNNLAMTNNIPIPNPNAQNQIFIINQFNKNNMTDLEKCLLNYLIPQGGNNVPGTYYQPVDGEAMIQPTKTNNKDNNINNADKLLINNIKNKLKPIGGGGDQPKFSETTQKSNLNQLNANPMSSLNSMSGLPNMSNQVGVNNMSNINCIPNLTNTPNLNNIGSNMPNMSNMNAMNGMNGMNCMNSMNGMNGMNSLLNLPYNMNLFNTSANLMNPNNNINALLSNPIYADPNVLINNFTGMTNPNHLLNFNQNTFNNLNNSMDLLKNFLKLNEPGVDMNKYNYGFTDYLGNDGLNSMFNNTMLDQLKQNVGSYNQVLNDLMANNRRSNPQQVKDVKSKVKLFNVEKKKKK
jgi:hypothetical protein